MLGNIVGGFMVVFIGFTLFPMISQELNNAMSCNSTNYTLNQTYEQPIGSTDSFGGGGVDAHFGGYDGEVKKSWSSNLAIYKTNESILNPNCNELSGSTKTMIDLAKLMFIVAIVLMGFFLVFNAIRNSGLGESGL